MFFHTSFTLWVTRPSVAEGEAGRKAVGTTLEIDVRRRAGSRHGGLLRCGERVLPCLLGRSGITALKREGDGATPLSRMRPVAVLYRPDREHRPATRLPVRALRPDDGWCDAPLDPAYNRPVRLPFPASAETMWRDDRLYDLVVVLDWNLSRRAAYRGSAIFMHLTRPDGGATEGCIALAPGDLRGVVARLTPRTVIRVMA